MYWILKHSPFFTHAVREDNDDTAHKRNCWHGSREMIIKSFVCHGQVFRYALWQVCVQPLSSINWISGQIFGIFNFIYFFTDNFISKNHHIFRLLHLWALNIFWKKLKYLFCQKQNELGTCSQQNMLPASLTATALIWWWWWWWWWYRYVDLLPQSNALR